MWQNILVLCVWLKKLPLVKRVVAVRQLYAWRPSSSYTFFTALRPLVKLSLTMEIQLRIPIF